MLGIALGAGVTVGFLVVSELLHDAGQTKRQHTEACLADIARTWVAENPDGACPGPGALARECGPGEAMTDYWGQELVVVCTANVGIAVASSGADRRWDTEDDLVRLHPWR